MCGIAGIVDIVSNRPIEPARLKAMMDAIAHRGPDGEGAFVEPGVAIGHRRLAVIDIEGGAQPFQTADGLGILTYNGEIYNYLDCASTSIFKDGFFRTRSDTEVLAEGLTLEGPEFTDRLRGMFAFAHWRRDLRQLLLARDRLGERPLYYAETPDGFIVFASEIQAVLASGMVANEIDDAAFSDYLVYGYVPEPKSIYKSIRKLRPGERLIATRGGSIRLERYWLASFSLADQTQSFDDAAVELADRLDEAVRVQMISDVPIGAFLSGGVDSSAIAASMALAGNSAKVCTVGFEDAATDERSFARAVAERYGLAQTVEMMALDAGSLIPRIARAYGEPFADSSALPTYQVCAAARRMATVALSGDGGDETFVGYRRYPMVAAEMRTRRAIPAALRRLLFAPAGAIYPKADWAPRFLRARTTLQSLGEDDAAGYARAIGMNLPERVRGLLSTECLHALGDYDSVCVIENAARSLPPEIVTDPVRYAQAIDLETWLPGRMLTKVDRASMAHGLEVRAPFLDPELVGWANGLPTSFKLKDGLGKRVLKRAMEARLPNDILYRPKQGFALPLKQWLANPHGPLDAFLASPRWKADGRFNEAAVEKMAARHRAGVSDCSNELWTLIMWDAFLETAA
ncbi:MAG: asparagine synthase (glutamine-hydrolyzing) [Alphaproteobacteria bacterium]|nr:asparagine synthase (glutamine-hydrolyzing) [Alphaproteobacteria bacterium]